MVTVVLIPLMQCNFTLFARVTTGLTWHITNDRSKQMTATKKQIRQALIDYTIYLHPYATVSRIHQLTNKSLTSLIGLEVTKNIIDKLDKQSIS
jgi:hypothetical protein